MKLERQTKGNEELVVFVPETLEEQHILGGLRNHFFFGDDKDKTYPQYDGITSERNLVTSLRLKYKLFEKHQ